MMASADPLEWVQLDGFGRVTDQPFHGTAGELRAHLLKGLPDGVVQGPRLTDVYIRSLVATVNCPLVTLTTPWGSTRWIPRPGAHRPHWSDHLLL
jgi:hypothetical protein